MQDIGESKGLKVIGDNDQIAYYQKAFLGQGNYGKVYLGQLNDNTKVAVKQLKNKISKTHISDEKFMREIECLKRLDHPNIIKFYSSWYDKEKHKFYVITELCDKKTLFEQITVEMSEGKAFEYAYQLVDAMTYMHSKNIIHRDIKPANIFISLNRTLKIGDLGLAKAIQKIDINIPFDHTPVASPLYAPPSFFQDNPQKFSAKCDVWAAGHIFYEMLYRKNIFSYIKHIDQFKKQLKKIQTLVKQSSEIPPFWSTILGVTLRYKEEDRATSSQLFQLFKEEKKKRQQKILPFIPFIPLSPNKQADDVILLELLSRLDFYKEWLSFSYDLCQTVIEQNEDQHQDEYNHICTILCLYLLKENQLDSKQFIKQFNFKNKLRIYNYQLDIENYPNSNSLVVQLKNHRRNYIQLIEQRVTDYFPWRFSKVYQRIGKYFQIFNDQQFSVIQKNKDNNQLSKKDYLQYFKIYFINKKDDLYGIVENLSGLNQLKAIRVYLQFLMIFKREILFQKNDDFAESTKKIRQKKDFINKNMLAQLKNLKVQWEKI